MSVQSIKERRHTVEAVRDVVSAMRATAAGRIQGAQRTMAAARKYREVVLHAIAAASPPDRLPQFDREHRRAFLIVLTSEQPLCGGFNHAVIDRTILAHEELRQKAEVELVGVGQRGSRAMAARGLEADAVEPGATSLAGLRAVVHQLSSRADHAYATGIVTSVELVYAKYRSVSEHVPTLERLLPIEPAILPKNAYFKSASRYLPDTALIAGLLSQFAYISLYHAVAESYASEQASRLVAMDAATRNTDTIIEDLANQERHERQHEITQQMLELTASRFAYTSDINNPSNQSAGEGGR